MLKSILGFLLILPSLVFATHCRNTLQGKVLDADSKQPLAYANIYISELHSGTVANENGVFKITDLCDGKFQLKITHVGCSPIYKTVELPLDSPITILLDHSAELLEAISISGTAPASKTAFGTQKIALEKIAQAGANSLAKLLSNEAGLSMQSTGNNVQKPAIHGLNSNRIRVLNNGIKQEAQQWGTDHAPEISISNSESILVYKGANTLRFGANAMGGVIVVNHAEGLDEKGVSASTNNSFESNGNRLTSGLNMAFNTGGKLKLFGALGVSGIKAGNYKTPEQFITNTGQNENNVNYNLGRKFGRLKSQIFYSNYQAQIGIFDGSHLGNLTDLYRVFEQGYITSADSFTYKIGTPKQEINHELVKVTNEFELNKTSNLQLTLSRQYNIRQEFDSHRNASEKASIQFEKTTQQGELLYNGLLNKWSIQAGLQGGLIKNTYEGLYFIPGYLQQDAGAFVLAKNYVSESLFIESGLRMDVTNIDAFNIKALNNRDSSLSYQVFSYQFSIQKNIGNSKFSLQNGLAWRPPSVNELFSNGLHHGSARIEIGNSGLKAERAYNTSLEWRFNKQNKWGSNLFVYYNYYPNFIYLLPNSKPALTIRGAFPVFNYQQNQAQHFGFDFNVFYNTQNNWNFDFSFASVTAKTNNELGYLPDFPADNFVFKSTKTIEDKKAFLNHYWMEIAAFAKQWRLPNYVPSATETSLFFDAYGKSPKGYALVNLGVSGSTPLSDKVQMECFATLNNVLNHKYRSYTNSFRFYVDEQGRSLTLGVKIKYQNQQKKTP